MEECSPSRMGELLMEMLLVHMACSSRANRKTGIAPLYKRLLETYGITVNVLEVDLLELRREGNKIQHQGTFKIDLVRNVGVEGRVRSEGRFTAIFNEGGAIRIEYEGDNFRMVSSIANVGTETGNIVYQISEVTSAYGKSPFDSLALERADACPECDAGGDSVLHPDRA
ncbi:MAG: hypothetical protein QMD46_03920 [Methanomicrobiales archaeon]|nr:hypothetical protein [Methanomicrobiales archaeon]MDI6876821.1 hypothetical protein [Methanomicrobiales archaeon]